MAFKFEKLKVWERAVDLSGDVSDLVKTFPKDEQYGLSSQIKRACDILKYCRRINRTNHARV